MFKNSQIGKTVLFLFVALCLNQAAWAQFLPDDHLSEEEKSLRNMKNYAYLMPEYPFHFNMVAGVLPENKIEKSMALMSDSDERRLSHYAAMNGNIDAIKKLMDFGDHMLHLDKNQKTPIDFAIEHRRQDVVDLLFADDDRVRKWIALLEERRDSSNFFESLLFVSSRAKEIGINVDKLIEQTLLRILRDYRVQAKAFLDQIKSPYVDYVPLHDFCRVVIKYDYPPPHITREILLGDDEIDPDRVSLMAIDLLWYQSFENCMTIDSELIESGKRWILSHLQTKEVYRVFDQKFIKYVDVTSIRTKPSSEDSWTEKKPVHIFSDAINQAVYDSFMKFSLEELEDLGAMYDQETI